MLLETLRIVILSGPERWGNPPREKKSRNSSNGGDAFLPRKQPERGAGPLIAIALVREIHSVQALWFLWEQHCLLLLAPRGW